MITTFMEKTENIVNIRTLKLLKIGIVQKWSFKNKNHILKARFVFKIWEIVKHIKPEVDTLHLVLIMKTKFPIYFAKIELILVF